MGVYDDYLKSRGGEQDESSKDGPNGVGAENEKPKTEGEDKA